MRFFPVLCLWLWAQWATAATLPAAVAQLLVKHQVADGDISLWIQATDAKQPLAELNGQVLRTPASVTKLLTTAAGLVRLGADFRWQTGFYADALPDASGVVNGNLYIVGGGDPFLVDEKLTEMVSGLRNAGVRHITGNIVLDDSLYRLNAAERDKGAFDGKPWAIYNAVPNPLMVNFRTLKLQAIPQSGAKQVQLRFEPEIANWKIDNRLHIYRGKCRHDGFTPAAVLDRDTRGYAVVHINGRYNTGCGAQEAVVSVGEAAEQFYYLFREIWYKSGGSFDGGGKIGRLPSTAKKLYIGYSAPLAEQIRKMNQYSNNVMTRQLFLTLGIQVYGRPGSLAKSRQALQMILQNMGVNTAGMVVDNGAGLSRKTGISAEQLATLLRVMYFSGQAETFLQSLAVAGESGTLHRRYRGSALAERVIGKTGTLDKVRAFAGFVRSANGHHYIVVIIGNGESALKSRALQDDIFRWVYEQ